MNSTQPSAEPPGYQIVLQRLKTKMHDLQRYIEWEDQLFANPHLSATHKLELRATRRVIARAQTHDEQGRTRINYQSIAEQIGVSPDTVSRGMKYLEQCGVIADKDIKSELQENGERWTRVYVALNDDLVSKPKEIQPPQPRNHGGNRYLCQQCGSDRVTIKRRVSIVCQCCQHESLVAETETDQESEKQEAQVHDDPFLGEQGRNVQCPLKPDSPPVDGDGQAEPAGDISGLEQEHSPQDGQASQSLSSDFQSELKAPGQAETSDGCENQSQQEALDDQMRLHAGAQLLLALAGEHHEHIEMSRSGKAKYYTVHRSLTVDDLLDHLCGGRARGAPCSYENGRTRGLGWDTDTADAWAMLQEAARRLAEAGYQPVLEPSPADRGGHLWLIYDALVEAEAARQHVYSLAPELAEIKEYWPGPQEALRWNRVRLPGGKYVRPGVRAWCSLVSVADGETSRNGLHSAQLLLTHQTKACILQEDCHAAAQEEDEAGHRSDGEPLLGVDSATSTAEPPPTQSLPHCELDTQWQNTYSSQEGKKLWFAFTPPYVAAWYNARHSVDELLPSERNGYGLANWRGERTASVKKYGETWADYGASARRADGSPDGGDVLDLQCRVSQAPKPEVLRQAARELVSEARTALEHAARSGEALPAWVEEIITNAGRDYYARIAGQAGHQSDPRNAEAQTEVSQAQREPISSEETPTFAAGQAVTWRHVPRGGYGYVYPVDATVVGVSGNKLTLRVQKQDGTWKEVRVDARNVRPQAASSQGEPTVINTPAASAESEPERPHGGLTGFSNAGEKTPPSLVGRQHLDDGQETTVADGGTGHPPSEAERLAQERGLQHGAPCPACGCELSRQMAEYTVCVRCYPPRGYDQYSDQVDALYPRRRTRRWS
ncbi:MAG TPA: winged helix-turn-helix domain-containing protein [Ktedonosporobacter sp.]|nr:winged helix-turn-helix domain-containing protein [Ktedonosporobacter sp.]